MKIKNNREVSESVIQEINHSVIKQLRSDVPIGVYCGGGVDSTLVAHLASQKNRNIEGLNLVLGETTFDEKDYVKKNFQGKIPLNFFQPNETSISNIILNEVNREVQSAGWKFNTSYKVQLSRNVDNKIPVSTDAMHIELNPLLESKSSYDPVIRGNFLYNLSTESFVFNRSRNLSLSDSI